MDGKMCPVCREYKEITEFGTRMRNGKNIGQGYCIACKRAMDRVYQRARREAAKEG